jgi:hypothetical protein
VEDDDVAHVDVEDEADSDGGLSGRSGDTVGPESEADFEQGNVSAVAARRTTMAQPKNRVVGDLRRRNEPAERNQRFDVGNFGMFVGNWGERSGRQKKATVLHDCQIKGSPGEIIVLLEANEAVKDLLEEEAQYVNTEAEEVQQVQRVMPRSRLAGEKAPVGNVSAREWYKHLTQISKDPKGSILMAARANVCEAVECVHSDSWIDGTWRETKTRKDRKNKERSHQSHGV